MASVPDSKRHAYLLTFNGTFPADKVRDVIDAVPEIIYWYRPFATCYLLIATIGIKEIDAIIERDLYQQRGMYVVTRIDSANMNGRMPKQFWHAVQNPGTPFPPK